VLSRLDYGSAVLFGLPQLLINKLLFRTLHSIFGARVATTSARCCGMDSVSDFALRPPLLWLFRGPVDPSFVIELGFSAAATSVRNSLPEAVRSSTSLALFKKTLKTELFVRSCTD